MSDIYYSNPSIVNEPSGLKYRPIKPPSENPNKSTVKQLQRTNSFGQFVSTYNKCAQNLILLPNLLNWLNTSILKNSIDKLITNLKTGTIRYLTILISFTLDVTWDIRYGKISRKSWLQYLVYLSVIFVYLKLFFLVCLLITCEVPWGVAFLLLNVLVITTGTYLLILPTTSPQSKPKEKTVTSGCRKYGLSYKTLSKIRLFY